MVFFGHAMNCGRRGINDRQGGHSLNLPHHPLTGSFPGKIFKGTVAVELINGNPPSPLVLNDSIVWLVLRSLKDIS